MDRNIDFQSVSPAPKAFGAEPKRWKRCQSGLINVVATGLWPVDLYCLSHQGRTAHRAVATAATVLLNRSRQGKALYSASDAALRQRALQPALRPNDQPSTINYQLSLPSGPWPRRWLRPRCGSGPRSRCSRRSRCSSSCRSMSRCRGSCRGSNRRRCRCRTSRWCWGRSSAGHV